MAREREVKLKIDDTKAFLRALKKLKAKPFNLGNGRVHEWNVIFDTPQGGLAKHGQLLRIRTETPESRSKKSKASPQKRTVLTFKQPTTRADETPEGVGHVVERGRHKVREEIEMEVAESDTLTKIFEGLGMRGWFRYEKYRTTYKLPPASNWARDLLIELDETPIGTYVELEGPAEAIDRAAKELGFAPRDYVLKNYLALYLEECRRRNQQPRDMLFSGPE